MHVNSEYRINEVSMESLPFSHTHTYIAHRIRTFTIRMPHTKSPNERYRIIHDQNTLQSAKRTYVKQDRDELIEATSI